MKQNLDIHSITDKLGRALVTARTYAALIFVLFLLSVYGYLFWRISVLSQLEPDASAVSSQLKAAGVPHIDEDVARKIEQLKDNSVNVQTLFDQARDNPFQENDAAH